MLLKDQLVAQGDWLFRWRSYLPFILFVPLAIVIANFQWVASSHPVQHYWELGCISVSLLGLFVRIQTIGHVPRKTSGRNTRKQLASSLNTTGMYSVVRNPLYLGNFLVLMGIVAYWHSWWFQLICIMAFWLYYERIIIAEEEFLLAQFGDDFRQWVAMTPAFIPSFRRWNRPALPFSWKMVLNRESSTILLISLVFAAMEEVGDAAVTRQWTIEPIALGLFVLGILAFLAINTLRKWTSWLTVVDR